MPLFPFSQEPTNLFEKQIFLKVSSQMKFKLKLPAYRALIILTILMVFQLGEYIQQAARLAYDNEAVWEFLELSSNNFSGIVKVKETFILKRSGGRYKQRCHCSLLNVWQKRFLAITSEGLMYSHGNRGEHSKIREMLMFDHNFSMTSGKE